MMKKACLLWVGICCIVGTAFSQLCTGSLGDPVVNISFGNDLTSRGPLKAGITSLSYINGSCPNDGEYTITNLAFNCFNNTWHLMAGDHTGDIGGRFMLINASLDPSDFYVDTVSGLCSNTVYEFAAWVTNVLRLGACSPNPTRPNLSFSIETVTGTILKKIETGDIPEKTEKIWQQFGTFFQTPAGVSTVVLRIRNNGKGGCGNDLALDDITFRPCGPEIKNQVGVNDIGLLQFCENTQTNISFNAVFSQGFTDPVLQWQMSRDTGKTWTDIAGERSATYVRQPVAANGYYQYRVTIAERANAGSVTCRIASNIVTVVISPMPPGPSDRVVKGCVGTDLRLPTTEGSGFSYQWTGPNGFQSVYPSPRINPVQFSDSGLYILNLQTDLGCSRTDSLQLNVYPGASARINPVAGICEGTQVLLQASGGISYQWSPQTGLSNPAAATTLASPRDTTVYKMVTTNAFGCADSAYIQLNVWKLPRVAAGNDVQLFEGDTTTLQGQITGLYSSFYWLPAYQMNNPGSLQPVVQPDRNTAYTLYATSSLGCGTVSDTVLVKVYRKIKAPNVFTPNGDGIHDTWEIPGLDSYPGARLELFTRAGQSVFSARDYAGGWDGRRNGKPLPAGTYYYVIDLGNNLPRQSGWLLLMR